MPSPGTVAGYDSSESPPGCRPEDPRVTSVSNESVRLGTVVCIEDLRAPLLSGSNTIDVQCEGPSPVGRDRATIPVAVHADLLDALVVATGATRLREFVATGGVRVAESGVPCLLERVWRHGIAPVSSGLVRSSIDKRTRSSSRPVPRIGSVSIGSLMTGEPSMRLSRPEPLARSGVRTTRLIAWLTVTNAISHRSPIDVETVTPRMNTRRKAESFEELSVRAIPADESIAYAMDHALERPALSEWLTDSVAPAISRRSRSPRRNSSGSRSATRTGCSPTAS